MIGRSLLEFVHPDDFGVLQTAFTEAKETKEVRAVIYRARHFDQHYVWLETTLQLMKSATGQETSEILCISRNVSERKRLEERLHDLARTDHLTSLPNGSCWMSAWRAGWPGPPRRLAACDADDRHRSLQEHQRHAWAWHGRHDAQAGRHHAQVMHQGMRHAGAWAATNSSSCCRDSRTPSRDGHRAALSRRAEEPFVLDGQGLHIHRVDRISVSPDSSADAEAMLKNADTAMYRAKAQGGDCLVLYRAEMSAARTAGCRWRMRCSMRSRTRAVVALPAIDLGQERAPRRRRGIDTLAKHPSTVSSCPPIHSHRRGNRTHRRIGEWVLHTACTQMNAWYRKGFRESRCR
jgi:GGDEF domain-containing protein